MITIADGCLKGKVPKCWTLRFRGYVNVSVFRVATVRSGSKVAEVKDNRVLLSMASPE